MNLICHETKSINQSIKRTEIKIYSSAEISAGE